MKRALAILLLSLLALAGAQELRVGIVLPFGSQAGAEWNRVISGIERSIGLQSSQLLRSVSLLQRDDGGSPARAAALVRELVTVDDVHVIVCCSDLATADAVQIVAQELQVLALSLAAPSAMSPGGTFLTLQPDLLTGVRAITLGARRHAGDLSLMTVAGARGDRVEAAFRDGALEAGLPVMRVVRFEPGAYPLTPEALLAATSQAEVVVVWASEADSREAVRSLGARGWDGPIVLDYLQAAALAAVGGSADLEFAVPPALITGSLPPGSPNQAAVSAWRVASGAALIGADASLDGALLYDALQLVRAAHEQALVYGASLDLNSAQVRSAIHDGLVGSGTTPLAAGTYRYSATTASLAQPSGLVPAAGRNGRFTPLSP